MKFFATVPLILITLEPGTNFNPSTIWREALLKEEQAEREAEAKKEAEENANKKHKQKQKKAVVKKIDAMREDNAGNNEAKSLLLEVTRVRNSKANLLKLVRDIKMPEARAALMVEILQSAYETVYKKTGDKKLLFETLWAIEGIELSDFNIPRPVDVGRTIFVKDYSLVYDNYKNVKKLLQESRTIMKQEKDLVYTQLVEMSDSLPPLSVFSFGFKLDKWQKRVLRWIDSGKSVVICAPTSSGKTVLSSYVALIFKSDFAKGAASRRDGAGITSSEKDKEKEVRINYEDQEVDDDEEESSDEYDEEEETMARALSSTSLNEENDPFLAKQLAKIDRQIRREFLEIKPSLTYGEQRILFVVPTEPLVWQVASYFTKLLREAGELSVRIAIVTDQMTYYPPDKFDVMPQIVVGTPMSLETALTKCRGLTGDRETMRLAQGDILPGGFDHFDWVIYDEVHSLDGGEGAALQRLIRSMNCKFLALSATVGNAEELRGWMESVKGDQLLGVETITVTASDSSTVEVSRTIKTVDNETTVVDPSVTKVTIVKTLTGDAVTLEDITEATTIFQLKEKLYAVWPSIDPEPIVKHSRYPVQFVFKGVDLIENDETLGSYKVFHGATPDKHPVIYMRLLVNMVVHQGRFINLQRYQWDGRNNSLMTINPLAAVESVEVLRNGILQNSSLSFTSIDSYRVWEEIYRIYPYSAVCHLDPHNFFGANERIVLQRSKDYEDLLKAGLKTLAEQFPKETQELLYHFQLPDTDKEFDLCDVILQLKEKEMLPCLPFHLNTFEAIRLFQQLLAGIEWRQKRDFPTYYMDLEQEKVAKKKDNENKVKSKGKNEKELEEAKRTGDIDTTEDFTVDPYAPHPKYILSMGTPVTDRELTDLVQEMEKFDGFEKRDNEAMQKQPGKNQQILKHALIRGLRRGIGLFINEVSFPSYRRAVQKLASRGKLAVVISDDSLAFGVNMPFRTCLFCGEMFDTLDELMAQQMSGRAGRRGLDTQGNLVYAGIRASRVRKLMIGTVANITGEKQSPRYESLFLQPILSPRHVGWSRAEVIGGKTLFEHINNIPPPAESYTLETSRKAMMDLGLIVQQNGQFLPNYEYCVRYGLLAAIWQLRDHVDESITFALLVPNLLEAYDPLLTGLSFSEKFSDAEKLDPIIHSFFVIFCMVFDRTPYVEGVSSCSLREACAASQGADFYNLWEEKFKSIQLEMIPDHLSVLRSLVPPGTELDGTLCKCLVDRNYVFLLGDLEKQLIKQKLWRAGNIFRIINNSFWPERDYQRFSFFVARSAFEKTKYLNSELIRRTTDFIDVSSSEREKRTDDNVVIAKPVEALPWSDNSNYEQPILAPLSWCESIGTRN